MAEVNREFGVVGLGRMGANISLQALEKDMRVVDFDIRDTPEELRNVGMVEVDSLNGFRKQLSPAEVLRCWCHGSVIRSWLIDLMEAAYRSQAGLDTIPAYVEDTGNSTVAFQAMSALGTNGTLCLMGVSTGRKPLEINASCLNMQMVLGNKMVFGTVSSNRGHFERAIRSLAIMERNWPGWLSRLITRRLTLDMFRDALYPAPDTIKTVIALK